MRAVHAGPLTGLVAQVLLLAGARRDGVGLGAAGWVVGLTCGVIMSAGPGARPLPLPLRPAGAADWVTLARATLAVGVAALVADSFAHPVPVTLLVSLAALALVARRGRRMGRATHENDARRWARTSTVRSMRS